MISFIYASKTSFVSVDVTYFLDFVANTQS